MLENYDVTSLNSLTFVSVKRLCEPIAMIKTEYDALSRRYQIILTANASMTPRQMHVVLGCVLFFLGTTGFVLLTLGAWPVLPFAGLEWLLLAYCMRRTLDGCSLQEVITLSGDVLVWKGSRETRGQSTLSACMGCPGME